MVRERPKKHKMLSTHLHVIYFRVLFTWTIQIFLWKITIIPQYIILEQTCSSTQRNEFSGQHTQKTPRRQLQELAAAEKLLSGNIPNCTSSLNAINTNKTTYIFHLERNMHMWNISVTTQYIWYISHNTIYQSQRNIYDILVTTQYISHNTIYDISVFNIQQILNIEIGLHAGSSINLIINNVPQAAPRM